MKKFFSKIAALSVGLALAVGVGVAVNHGDVKVEKASAADVLLYTLNGTVTGGSSGYAAESSIEQDGVTWKVTGNTTMNPWRIGGNSLTNVDRPLYSTSAFSGSVSKVDLEVGTASSITVNSLKLYASTSSDFSNADEVSGTFAVNSTITFTPTSGDAWEDCYFKVVFNVSVSGTSNKFVQFKSLKLYEPSSATLESIELRNDGAKTEYVDGDNVSFEGIKAIGIYSNSSESDITSSCTITADRAKVSTGETKITYSATYSEGGFTIEDLDLNISVVPLAVEKVEKNGNYRTSFVEKQKFSYGTGAVKVTWNNGSTATYNPSASGVTTTIGDLDITGQTHYMTMDDNGKDLIMSYGGKSFTVGTISVTPYVEPENGYWSEIIDLGDLEDGLEVIIVAEQHDYAMGKYTSGTNVDAIDISKDAEGKISSSIPGVEVYTLVDSDVVPGAFALKDSSDKYLAATGAKDKNVLTTEDTISEKSSFMVSIADNKMSVVSQTSVEGAGNTIRYNTGSIIFSCYKSSSTTGSLACLYKFTKESKSEDQIAVENFVKSSLKLDDSKADYIDPNDNTPGTNCLGEAGLYNLAKIEYAKLTDEQKEIFGTSSDVLIMQGRARMVAWASANGEEFDPVAMTFNSLFNGYSLTNADSNNMMIIIVVISSVTVLSLGVLIALKKKKHN